MRAIVYFLFLFFFILTGVLVGANLSYLGEFFFLAPFEGQPLALPFLGFACLGVITGILFRETLRYIFSSPQPKFKERTSDEST